MRIKRAARVKRWSEGVFRIDDAWTDRLVLSVPLSNLLPWQKFSVEFDGERRDLTPKRLRGTRVQFEPVKFPFDQRLVTRFRVFRGDSFRTECREEGDRSRMLFEHDPKAVHRNIQRRGALKEGKGFQLVCALQAFLWAESPGGVSALGDDAERLKARAVALCSATYRLMERPSLCTPSDVALREARATALTEPLDLTSGDARWYPSVKLAIAQLQLVTGDVEACVRHLIDIADRQETILAAEPICAFNIALGDCLLAAILDARSDPRFEKYRRHWEHIFRNYPPRMDLRFGTMEEFGKIYEACMLNYKLELARTNCRDARFRATTLDEILEACFRVRVPDGAVQRTLRAIGGEPQARPKRRKRGFVARLGRWLKGRL